MGSALGTAADVVDELRDEGIAAGVLGVTCYRPWPHDELRDALRAVPRAVVVNRAIAVGAGSTARPGRAAHRATRNRGPRRRAWGSAADRSRGPDCASSCSTSCTAGSSPAPCTSSTSTRPIATAELAREEEVTVT